MLFFSIEVLFVEVYLPWDNNLFERITSLRLGYPLVASRRLGYPHHVLKPTSYNLVKLMQTMKTLNIEINFSGSKF
jgi:hypothetical protein